MKKFATIIMAIMILLLCFASCGQKKSSDEKPSGKADVQTDEDRTNTGGSVNANITPAEIEAKIAAAIGSENYRCSVDISADTLSGYYGLDLEKIESYMAKESDSPSVYMDQVVILKVKDGYASAAIDKLNEAFAQLVSYVNQYPFGVQKVKNARIYQSGNIVALILTGAEPADSMSQEDELKLAQSEYEKVDAAWKGIFGSVPANRATVPQDEDNSGFDTDGGNGALIGG